MNERQMRYISAIAREGSIQKASSCFGKNPSTLTRALKSCEGELGVILFKRTRERMVLTPEGETVLQYAGKILEMFDWLEGWMQEWNGGHSGESRKLSKKRGDVGTKSHDWTENEIRYLLSIREWKNISRAAEDQFIAQPSLSQMLRELEEDLGNTVFIRTKEGASETEFGAELLLQLERIQSQYQRLRIELEEYQEMKRGTITFGIPMNLGTYLIPLVVPAFCRQYPGIRIRIRENNSSDLERMMIAKKIDFCILHFHKELEQVQYEFFSWDPFYLVIPKSMKENFHFPEDRGLMGEDLRQLSSAPFVMVAQRQQLRVVVDRILDAAGVRPDICCTTKSMETAKRLVAAGMGVTFLPRSYLTLYSGVEGLESYPVDESLNASWKLVAAYPREGKLSRSSREFLRILKECMDSREHDGQRMDMRHRLQINCAFPMINMP